ncbi:MAG: multiheme c-type cytochrome [Bacteroidota bacterium]
MKKFSTISIILFMVICISGILFAQTPVANIALKGVTSWQSSQPLPNPYRTISSGLPNVARGTNVWIEAQALRGTVPSSIHLDTLQSVVWSILSAPTGSVATIAPVDTPGLNGFKAVIVPDKKGPYQLGLIVTTANGTSSQATIWISAGHWVGAGTPDSSVPQCASCHTDKYDTWSKTHHATAFARKISDTTGHFGKSCVSCHSVGYNTMPSAVNNGFDDIATALGWVFPATIKPTNWDSMVINYPTLAAMANIQCENCHGPGSQHGGQISKNQIGVSLSAELCGQCHDAPTHHPKNYEWKASLHATSNGEGINYQALNRDPCAQCHTAQGFIDKTIKGGSLAVPYADVQPVSCAACHDPHALNTTHQLRRASLADACTGCHHTRISSRGLHTSGQGPMLAGSTGTPFDGNFKPDPSGSMIGDFGGMQLPGYPYPNSAHTAITDKCVVCHMAPAPADSLYGLPANTLLNKIGDHTFKVFWNGGTPDSVSTADDIINPMGCNDCHQHINGTVNVPYVRNSQAEIVTLLAQLQLLLPQKSGSPVSFNDPSLNPIQKAGSYNWNFVTNDGSFGVHNHAYAKALLQACIDQLKLTAGASTIDTVKDVPNDEGKVVQLIWSQFPTERLAINPVIAYNVWRKDPGTALGKESATKVGSLREMFAHPAPNAKYTLGADIWTFVGSVPAANLPKYSFDAPTLFDSTIVKGMYMTTFYVSGQTNNSAIVYSTPPDSGYSVDNLLPNTPTGLTSKSTAQGIGLSWDQSADKDFNYFAVYRSTSANFDIKGLAPLTTLTDDKFTDNNVINGHDYYYKVTAYDFSGNQSLVSNEIHVIINGVTDVPAMPNEFALQQNYPNPFNPTTEVKYQMPQAGHIRITIFNTLGVEITKLVDQDQAPGYYTARWNGKDQSGMTVSSGIYLYRMEAGSFSTVKKMILMK